MVHKIKIRIDDKLRKLMKKYPEIDYNKMMIEGIKDKLEALKVLDRLAKDSKLSEEEIEDFVQELLEKEKSKQRKK